MYIKLCILYIKTKQKHAINMLKGTWFLFTLLVVILASSMIFGSFGAIEGYKSLEGNRNRDRKPTCSGPSCLSA